MNERVVLFGPTRSLVGILTSPASGPSARGMAVILTNVGFNHRAGPGRLNVEAARALARHGFHVFRFDVAGLGDSGPRVGGGDAAGAAARELRIAIDWLEASIDVHEFLLVGLCSGVDTVHPVATDDARVAGAVFIDGYNYRTRGAVVRDRSVRWLQPARWLRFTRRRLVLWRERRAGIRPAGGPSVFTRKYPAIEDFRRDVARMVTRGVRLLFVWSGNDRWYNAERQQYELLGPDVPSNGIEVEYTPQADHLFSAIRHRRALLARLESWSLGVHAARRPAPRAADERSPDRVQGRGVPAVTLALPVPLLLGSFLVI